MVVLTNEQYARLLREAIARDKGYLAICEQGLIDVMHNINYYRNKIEQQEKTLSLFLAEHEVSIQEDVCQKRTT